MALTKTARLELINPYQKYGLKRRPTFDEIVGLVSENDKLIRPFPNREATRFRNSPQGSFFDGSDSLDVLKEQQTRILDRQMREAIMRREAQQNGGTLHLMKHQEQQTSGLSTPLSSESGVGFETPSSATSSIYHASHARHLEERVRQEAERQEEVRNKHREGLNKLNQTMMQGMMRRGLEGMREYEEEVPTVEEFIDTPSATQEPPSLPEPVYQDNIDYTNNIRFWDRKSTEYIKYQLFLRGVEAPNEGEISAEELGRGVNRRKRTYKQYLVDLIKDLVDDGSWGMPVSDEDVERRKKEWATMKGKGIGKSFSQSVAEGAKEGAKQVAKAAAVKGGELLIKKAFGM